MSGPSELRNAVGSLRIQVRALERHARTVGQALADLDEQLGAALDDAQPHEEAQRDASTNEARHRVAA